MDSTADLDTLAKTLAEDTLSAGAFDRLRAESLSDDGIIDALVASERLVRYAAGLQTRVLGSLAARQKCADELIAGVIESEVIAATRWSLNTTQRRLYEAGVLATVFPETLALLHAGQVCWPQAAALVDLTTHLEHDAARAVQARVLPRLPQQSVAATRKAVQRAVLAADPHTAQKRHEQETRRRRVVLCPEPDGMTTLALYTPAQTGAAIMAAIDQHAKPREKDDERTLDQRRADTLADLVLGSAAVPFRGTQGSDMKVPALVHVTVGIETLLRTNQEPAELSGYGPITATQARALAFAEGSVWRRLLTAPDGTLLHADPTTYRPTASVERLVKLRDRHCVFPGCTMPAARCDVDHIEPFDHGRPEQGGATLPENLQALCRRHHRMKTAGAWNVQRTDQGVTLWHSPTRHTYTTTAPLYAAA